MSLDIPERIVSERLPEQDFEGVLKSSLAAELASREGTQSLDEGQITVRTIERGFMVHIENGVNGLRCIVAPDGTVLKMSTTFYQRGTWNSYPAETPESQLAVQGQLSELLKT